MRSSDGGLRSGRGAALEPVLEGRSLSGFALLLIAMLAELTLAPFIELLPHGPVMVHAYLAIMIACLVGLHTSRARLERLDAGAPG